jgi:hypothetical protein
MTGLIDALWEVARPGAARSRNSGDRAFERLGAN